MSPRNHGVAAPLVLTPPPALRSMASRKKTKTYHATVLVTRVEEWCVEAESAEQARTLLAAGDGHRCHLGDCLNVELRDMLDDAA